MKPWEPENRNAEQDTKTDWERPENIQEGVCFGNGTNIPLQEVHQESTWFRWYDGANKSWEATVMLGL